jgi:hypothetical protein
LADVSEPSIGSILKGLSVRGERRAWYLYIPCQGIQDGRTNGGGRRQVLGLKFKIKNYSPLWGGNCDIYSTTWNSTLPNTRRLPPPLVLPSWIPWHGMYKYHSLLSPLSLKPLKMDPIEGSETSANINQTLGIHPKIETVNSKTKITRQENRWVCALQQAPMSVTPCISSTSHGNAGKSNTVCSESHSALIKRVPQLKEPQWLKIESNNHTLYRYCTSTAI